MDPLSASVTPPRAAGRRASVSSAAVLFTQDTSGYASVAVQVVLPGTSCTITYEASNDNATWTPVVGYAPGNTGATVPSATSTTAGLTLFPCLARFFRARVSAYGSGTVSVAAFFRKDDLARSAVFVAGDAASTTTKEVVGDAAHDAVIAGNPVRIGARAVTANYTSVATGDTADLVTTVVGALVTRPYSIPEGEWSYPAAASGIVNTTTAVTIKVAGGAGLRNYLTSMQVATDTLGGGTELAIRDGAGGTVIWRSRLQTAALPSTHIEFPIPLKSTANTLLEVVTLTAVSGGVYVNAQGYVAP